MVVFTLENTLKNVFLKKQTFLVYFQCKNDYLWQIKLLWPKHLDMAENPTKLTQKLCCYV